MWTEKIRRTINENNIKTDCMTYKDFCEGSNKKANMSVRKVFNKQLAVVFNIFIHFSID